MNRLDRTVAGRAMTTYRLPEALGGGEVEIVTPAWAGNAIICEVALVDQPDVKVSLARSLLTEVEPPLPPEPAPGSVLRCNDGYLHIRRGSGMARSDHREGYSTWAEIVASHDQPLVRLVPDPFAEPVELPWRQRIGKYSTATVSRTVVGEITLSLDSGGRVMAPDLTTADAKSIARALWAAADAAEAKS